MSIGDDKGIKVLLPPVIDFANRVVPAKRETPTRRARCILSLSSRYILDCSVERK
jgi:hypothetical protein